MKQQAGSTACTQDKRREFAENPTSRGKPGFQIPASYDEVTHENAVSILYRPVDDPDFIRIRHCLRLRRDPGHPPRLRSQATTRAISHRQNRRARFCARALRPNR